MAIGIFFLKWSYLVHAFVRVCFVRVCFVRVCAHAQIAGQQLYSQKMIPKYTLDTDPATHENLCDVCGMVESAHEKYITSRRPQDHVYKPRCTTNHTVSIGTFSLEPLEPHTDIREFVRSVCNKRDNYSVWANAIDFFEKLIHEVENTVQDSDLPVLDMTCKKFGIVNSFRFVLHATCSGEF